MTIRRRYAAVSAVATGALLLAGCGSAGGGNDDEGAGSDEATTEEFADTITVGIEQTPDAYNANTADANSVYNSYVDNITQQGFIEIQPDGKRPMTLTSFRNGRPWKLGMRLESIR